MHVSRAWSWSLLCLAAAGFLLVDRGSPAQEPDPGFRVIVHAENPISTLTRAEVSSLMLKKADRWPDGTEVDPVDLDMKSPVRAALSKHIHGSSIASIVSYWKRQIYSGRGVPPPAVKTDEEVVAYVRSHRGGIGYVSPSARLEGVRVVTVTAR